MGNAFVSLGAIDVVVFGIAYFSALYLLAGAFTWWLTHRLLPSLGVGRVLDPRPLPRGQLRRELRESATSILIFGVGLLLPWALLQTGWARLAIDPPPWRIALEIVALFLWNELHFYACHRVLHTRWLRRFHGFHHQSHVATPWSTYALHPVEALMLGSVPIIPMLMHDFSFAALVSLPIFSIVLNNLGHANYEMTLHAPARGWLGASRRHHLHHACYRGNYGFLLEVFDRWGGTVLPLDAADTRLAINRHNAPTLRSGDA